MNETLVEQPPPPQGAEEVASATPGGFGTALAQARARAGWTVEQAAARIHLNPRQLRAIEKEDLQALPAAAYVNGFVRNYAREVGIDAAPLVEDLNAKLKLRGLAVQELDLGPSGTISGPVLDDRGWRHLVLALIVAGLLCAGGIGAWRISHTERAAHERAAAAAATAAPPATLPASPQTAGAAAVAPTGASAAGNSSAANTATAPLESSTAVAVAPAGASGSGPQSAATAVATTATTVATVATVATPTNLGSQSEPAVPPASSASAPGDIESKAAAAANSRLPVVVLPRGGGHGSGLLLRFVQRSWVQVSRPDGQVLLSHMGEPGSLEMVNAAAPLVLIVGRADAVTVEYHGQPVDLKPYANSASGVAKVLLADAGAGNGGQTNR